MRNKTFVKFVRKLMVDTPEIRERIDADLHACSRKELFAELRAYVASVAPLPVKAPSEGEDNDYTELLPLLEEIVKTTPVPKGWRLRVDVSPNVGPITHAAVEITRRGNKIGYITLQDEGDGVVSYEALHYATDVGWDCIDSAEAAVQSVIDAHLEYISRKNSKRKS